jgi:hypothetical protein
LEIDSITVDMELLEWRSLQLGSHCLPISIHIVKRDRSLGVEVARGLGASPLSHNLPIPQQHIADVDVEGSERMEANFEGL